MILQPNPIRFYIQDILFGMGLSFREPDIKDSVINQPKYDVTFDFGSIKSCVGVAKLLGYQAITQIPQELARRTNLVDITQFRAMFQRPTTRLVHNI